MPDVIYADKSGEFYRGYYFTDTEQYIRADKHEELKAIADKMAGALETARKYIGSDLYDPNVKPDRLEVYSALTEYNKYKGE